MDDLQHESKQLQHAETTWSETACVFIALCTDDQIVRLDAA
jgi:hypothetical protein